MGAGLLLLARRRGRAEVAAVTGTGCVCVRSGPAAVGSSVLRLRQVVVVRLMSGVRVAGSGRATGCRLCGFSRGLSVCPDG
ncbi:hypothetical protein GCM10010129_73070 [Streptomyces fumigatiscleroticus]|nr:hypothetical protein GCM10010129_73070 [Streptomyces fumigatiscleroticus]